MSRTLFAAAVAAAVLLAGPGQARDAAAPGVEAPILAGAQAAPDCGGLPALAGRAFCVSAPLAGMEAVIAAYTAHFQSQGWLAADGSGRRVVFIKRREGGGCDGLQMAEFHDASGPVAADTPGYLGFAAIPGDVCAAQDPQ